MTDLQKKIEELELQGNDAELLNLLSCIPEARRRYRLLAFNCRLQAVALRLRAFAQAA
jgi:hypothetical protein